MEFQQPAHTRGEAEDARTVAPMISLHAAQEAGRKKSRAPFRSPRRFFETHWIAGVVMREGPERLPFLSSHGQFGIFLDMLQQ